MFLDVAVVFGFIFFTAYFIYKFVSNDFYGIGTAPQEKEKTDKLFSIIKEMVNKLPKKEREFVKKNGEDFALQYFDLKVKSLEGKKKKDKRVNEFYFYSVIKLEGELIFLLNYLKKHKELLEKMKGIKVPEEYYEIAKKWEKECFNYFDSQ